MKINFKGYLYVLAVVVVPFNLIKAQEVPDGTQGEMFDTLNQKKAFVKPEFSNWNYFEGTLTSLKIGGGLLYDGVTYIQDQVSEEQIPCTPAFKARDARITMSGQFKIKADLSWRFGYMYDGVNDEWFVRETGLMLGIPAISGKIFVGRTKEGYSMSKVMIGYAGWAMERQMSIDVIPILADGIKYLGYFPKKRIIVNLGIFSHYTSKTQSFSTYEWQTAARFGFLPVYSKEGNTVLHVAINTRYGKPLDGNIRLRSRPESNPSPYFVDTGVFPAEHSSHLGLETYYTNGPWMMGGEGHIHQFYSTSVNNPMFYGGEFMISYMLTGESRPYITNIAAFSFVNVKRPVFKGGPGALEFLLRMTNLNLDGGNITGGNIWRFTPMLNWYLSNGVRLELAYGYSALNRFGQIGYTHFFQSRIQFML